MGTLFVDKLDPQSGTSLELGSSGDTVSVNTGATTNLAGNVTLGASGKTITIPSGATITNSGTSTGFGKILQVVTNPVADTASDTIDSGAWEAVGSISVALTPSSTSSKINVSASVHYSISAINTGFSLNIYKDIGGGGYSQIRDLNSYRISVAGQTEQERLGFWSYSTTFSPNTTSAVTFKLYGITGGSAQINLKTLDLTAMEIGA